MEYATAERRPRLAFQNRFGTVVIRPIFCLLALVCIFSLAAEAQVTVAISPTSVTLEVNKTKQFAATVTGTTNTGVKWFVDGIQGGSTDIGTITTGGLYTAPAVAGNHVVSITSNADPTQSASSQVTVTAAAVVTIAISPTSVTLNTGATKQFAATVSGTTNTGVKWFVDGIQGGSADAGTITTGGLYTAPSVAGNHVVSITSNADPTKSATSQVTVVVPATITVAISPTSVTLNTGATKQFAATVSGTTNTGVKWFVDGIQGGSTDAGTITTGGLYTAPAVAGNHVVSITSNADPTKTASSQVTVTTAPAITITISPTSASVNTGGTKQFTATVSNTTNTGVTWFVDNVQGGDSTVGTISTSGLYTAPTTAGNHVVSVTSNADSTKSATAQVTVTTPTAITVSISPTSASVTTGTTKQFTATVTGTTNTGVKWFVDNVQGGSSTSGTITTGGLYTAPSTTGTHVVSITSNADPTQSASSQVTVTAPTAVSISITPTSATVPGTQTKQYQATVTGTTNLGVKWYVDDILNGNDTVGNISTSGLYLAPNTPSTHTIKVVSNADTTKFATSALTISGTIWVVMRPYTACVPVTKTLQYTASVQGTTNQNVNWQVDGTTGGSNRNGTINSSGLYTAPGTAGSHTIRAVSQANTSKIVSTTVTVASTVSVSVSPTPVSVPVGETQQFVARVCGNTNTGVNWFVDNIAGGNATFGTIDAQGNYTAPATAGSHTIKAVSQADTTKSGTATATVVEGITADFGGRTGGKPIPTELFGTNLTNLTDPNGFKLLTDAGLMHTRIYSNIQTVFSTRTPDWTKIDPIIQKLKTAGIRPMLEITYTPPWLVPIVSGCTQSFKMPPTDYAGYANIAAQFVAHMNQTFPDFIVDYEIWNEPDLASFCTSPNTDSQRLAVYQKLYAATAKAMHDQAALDGKPIRTGGPTNVTGSVFTWVPALVSNPSTAPYVDFISYHTYLTGLDSTQAGMDWDGTDGPKTLYAYEQDAGGGFAAWFQRISTSVRQGSQPNPTTTPIYVTEYNDNWSFTHNCCRNDPTIAPVFNGLAIVDYLDTVYAGAQQVPGKLYYYSASAFPHFCLIGTWDTLMTCTYPPGSVPVPYPQYHPYRLAASPNFLDLASGGNMATSVTPGFMQHGLTATAFYTNNKESILAVNPTSANFANVTFNFNNTGLSSAAGTAYRIDGPNNTIVATPVTLTTTSSGFSATIAVPAYSVVAVSIQ